MVSATRTRTKKLIIGCDGTWLNSDNGSTFLKGSQKTLETPSNVTRICRALQPRPPKSSGKKGNTDEGNYQVVCYKAGIGSAPNIWDRYVNGASAESISENIRDAYVSIFECWEEDTEIFLLGFSRGSFVARSAAAMVSAIGVLNKEGMEEWYNIFEDWENQNDPQWVNRKYGPKDGNKNFKVLPGDDYSSYARELEKHGLTTLDVPIKAVACWDTVGSLGIPQLKVDWPIIGPPLNWLFTKFDRPTRRLAFIDTEVLPNVSNCFHALALDEIRNPFAPTLWEIPAARKHPINLKQCWFPGAHANIGGSLQDAELPDIALAWMTAQLISCGLEFDDDYLAFCRKINERYYLDSGLPPRGWGMGYIYNPYKGIQRLAGKASRTPRAYRNVATGQPLRDTRETIHPSVRVRWQRQGKGMADVGAYYPPALQGWELRHAEQTPNSKDPLQKGYWWEMKDATAAGGGGSGGQQQARAKARLLGDGGEEEDDAGVKRLYEEDLEDIECMLLQTYKEGPVLGEGRAWEAPTGR